MAGLSPTDFRTTDKVSNSAWKGFTKDDSSVPNEKPNDKPTGKSSKSDTAKGFDFNSLSDEDKNAFSYALDDWQQAVKNPNAWAKQQAQILKINPKSLQKAAARMKQDLAAASPEEVFRYPWWSAARDWDPNEIGQMGQTIANGIKPSQAVISGVQQRF